MMANASPWARDDADAINRALAVNGGHLFVGEAGFLYLSEVAIVRGRLGLRIERDLHFKARKPLSAYARDAQQAGMIVTG